MKNNQEPTRECCEKCRTWNKKTGEFLMCAYGGCRCHKNECCKKCADWSNDGGRQCIYRDEEETCKCHNQELSPELSWEQQIKKGLCELCDNDEEHEIKNCGVENKGLNIHWVIAFIKKVEQQAVQQYAKEMFYKMKDFEKVHFNSGRASMVEIIEKICERHINWKATEGYGSEEELGFQKGLVAEAKLLSSDILQALKNKETKE